MGKHRRRERMQAITPLPPPHRMPKKPAKTVLNTCAITGERLDYTLPHVTIADDDRIYRPKHARCPEDLQPDGPVALGWRLSVPLRFHTRETRHDGAPRIAPAAMRYMQAGEQQRKASADYAWKYWWTPTWAERELRAHFPADVVDIVLAVCRDGQAWDHAMIGSERATADVNAYKIKMQQHCRNLMKPEQRAA